MVPRPYQLDFFADDDGDKPCLRWIKELTPAKRHAIGVAMEQILRTRGLRSATRKPGGNSSVAGCSAFRLMRKRRYEVKQKGRKVEKVEQISLRVFCHAYGDQRVLLLHGYDKGEDPKGRRQQREIETARQRLRKWQSQQRAKKRQS